MLSKPSVSYKPSKRNSTTQEKLLRLLTSYRFQESCDFKTFTKQTDNLNNDFECKNIGLMKIRSWASL